MTSTSKSSSSSSSGATSTSSSSTITKSSIQERHQVRHDIHKLSTVAPKFRGYTFIRKSVKYYFIQGPDNFIDQYQAPEVLRLWGLEFKKKMDEYAEAIGKDQEILGKQTMEKLRKDHALKMRIEQMEIDREQLEKDQIEQDRKRKHKELY